MTPLETLRRLGACEEGLAWVAERSEASGYDLWRSCPDGAHMLWFATRVGVELRLVGAACSAYEATEAVSPEDVRAVAYATAAYAHAFSAYATAAYAHAAHAPDAAAYAHAAAESARIVRRVIPWRVVRDALAVAP